MAFSQAAMHPGMSFPVAPPVIDEPPLVAMTSPSVPTIAAVGARIAALVGAWGTAPLVAVFGSRSPVSLGPIMVAVAATRAVLVEVAFGKLTADAVRSCAPGLD